jgi:RimJ/RimL family protein N-acetyltransferase
VMQNLSDVELLLIEMDLLWDTHECPELVVACARQGLRARVNSAVPEQLARSLVAEIERTPPNEDLRVPPARLQQWRILLEDAVGVAVLLSPASGPSYLIHEGVSFPASAPLVRSDYDDLADLRAANPGNWGADEWHDLLEGRLGPWAMARHEQRVISICHTPKANARAAEAGTWTHPDFRGQGHAASTTAEWAALMRASDRLLFYSTSLTNISSQRVARRLGLRQIGLLWQLRRRQSDSGWADPRVWAGPSTIEGTGLVAASPIRRCEIVFVWGGGMITSDAELREIAASGRR